MPKPSDIENAELRQTLEGAFVAMRAGKGAEAVRACASGYLRFLELHPEAKAETIAIRDRRMPRMLRWPALGANMDAESARSGAPKIEFVRDRFSVSEAMTYYQFVLDEILDCERRGGG
ncbi:MAG TPA: hypothetical protein VN805_12360 [Caulobacteraceae bacterium]|nr:hypothetical protein [Caulobacteraceae bacterium]